jgi:hypothetical protein
MLNDGVMNLEKLKELCEYAKPQKIGPAEYVMCHNRSWYKSDYARKYEVNFTDEEIDNTPDFGAIGTKKNVTYFIDGPIPRDLLC